MDESIFDKLKSISTNNVDNINPYEYLNNFINFPKHINPYEYNSKTSNNN